MGQLFGNQEWLNFVKSSNKLPVGKRREWSPYLQKKMGNIVDYYFDLLKEREKASCVSGTGR